ncbi:MAG: uracil phosphoribosyltransferase [Acidimicrobiia bacterium]|nr:uracil phosphoribosyltransferase [Acidimicrobiia bacterium]
MNITVIDHPLTRHYLTTLRDVDTEPDAFRAAARTLTYTLLMEATKSLKPSEFEVQTPLEKTTGWRMNDVVAVAVLRAGLGLLEAVEDLLPHVKIGFAGVQRNEETAEPEAYYIKLPDVTESLVIVLEPMLATGGSLAWAVEQIKAAGATDICALCVVAAPDGVKRMQVEHPDVRIVAASLDRELNESYYIAPGLGDMGDRLFGTL